MKEYKYKINGVEYTVNIQSVSGSQAKVTVNGTPYDVEIQNGTVAAAAPAPAVQPVAPAAASVAAAPKEENPQKTESPKAEAPAPSTQPTAANAPAGGTPIKAPLPGVINDVKVAVGDKVTNGQAVLILEAMKMENEITAECDGTVTAINVSKGDSVMEGTVLLTIG